MEEKSIKKLHPVERLKQIMESCGYDVTIEDIDNIEVNSIVMTMIFDKKRSRGKEMFI